jgi:hypothetical protein
MTDPYRDQQLSCPACKATLREYQSRQVCDGCDGMLLALPDLAHAIHDLTSITPTFEYRDEQPGKRGCPKCSATMTTCKLRVVLDTELAEPKPVLDRCTEHGLWFDGEELAGVFEKVASKGFGGGVGRKATRELGTWRAERPSMASGGWRGKSGVPEWWGGGGGGKWG